MGLVLFTVFASVFWVLGSLFQVNVSSIFCLLRFLVDLLSYSKIVELFYQENLGKLEEG